MTLWKTDDFANGFIVKQSIIQAFNFIVKRLQHSCFPVNITKIFRTAILKNICERLFLDIRPLNLLARTILMQNFFSLYVCIDTCKFEDKRDQINYLSSNDGA